MQTSETRNAPPEAKTSVETTTTNTTLPNDKPKDVSAASVVMQVKARGFATCEELRAYIGAHGCAVLKPGQGKAATVALLEESKDHPAGAVRNYRVVLLNDGTPPNGDGAKPFRSCTADPTVCCIVEVSRAK
jgi:hypothetical protein